MLQTLLALAALVPFGFSQTRPKPPKSVRLYVFDNGVIKGLEPTMFHLKKEEIATSDMVVCSYLIVHPKGTLMWDTGVIPDADLKADASPVTQGRFTATKTLKSQLAALGMPEGHHLSACRIITPITANANDCRCHRWSSGRMRCLQKRSRDYPALPLHRAKDERRDLEPTDWRVRRRYGGR
jgi:hypothetical protein